MWLFLRKGLSRAHLDTASSFCKVVSMARAPGSKSLLHRVVWHRRQDTNLLGACEDSEIGAKISHPFHCICRLLINFPLYPPSVFQMQSEPAAAAPKSASLMGEEDHARGSGKEDQERIGGDGILHSWMRPQQQGSRYPPLRSRQQLVWGTTHPHRLRPQPGGICLARWWLQPGSHNGGFLHGCMFH